MIKTNHILILAILMVAMPLQAKVYKVSSPSGRLALGVSVGDRCTWSLEVGGEKVLDDNDLALEFEGLTLGQGAKVLKQTRQSRSEHIVAPFYRQAEFDTKYNALTLKMKGGWSLELRAYDDGVAYRFATSMQGERKVLGEKAEFNFCKPYGMLVPYARISKNDRYRTSFESLYDEVNAGDASKADGRLAFMPVYVDLGDAGRLLLTESDLWAYPGMFLRTTDRGFEAEFPPYPNNTQVQDGKYLDYLNVVEGTRTYPWRIVAYAEDEKGLAVNNMVYQLATPCKLDDISWIKPGKSTWDWWNAIRRHGVDFKAGINTETYLYDIDFAAKYGIEYILIDDGWYRNKNIFNPIDGLDIRKICDHAAEKGVKVILWVSKGVLGLRPAKAFEHYSKMGVAGFKIDFFDSQEAAMVSRINMYAEEAAKYHLVLDFHGHFKPVGLNRTWPNVLNFEGVAGLENLKWAGSDFDMPRNDVILPFIRQAAGAMDYTPGALRNASKKEYRTVNERPMSQGTRAHQLACYVVFDEPFAMLCDSPSDYLKEDETTRWIASIPTVFDRTEILSAKIGEYVVTMREKDGKYYVGGLTNWEARDLAVDTSFLPEGNWKWKIFMDGKNADTVGSDYVLGFFNSITKDKGPVTIPLAPGGGFVIVFEK